MDEDVQPSQTSDRSENTTGQCELDSASRRCVSSFRGSLQNVLTETQVAYILCMLILERRHGVLLTVYFHSAFLVPNIVQLLVELIVSDDSHDSLHLTF